MMRYLPHVPKPGLARPVRVEAPRSRLDWWAASGKGAPSLIQRALTARVGIRSVEEEQGQPDCPPARAALVVVQSPLDFGHPEDCRRLIECRSHPNSADDPVADDRELRCGVSSCIRSTSSTTTTTGNSQDI